MSETKCMTCDGAGYIKPCPNCNGSGRSAPVEAGTAALEAERLLTRATEWCCSCGGKPGDDETACAACKSWHYGMALLGKPTTALGASAGRGAVIEKCAKEAGTAAAGWQWHHDWQAELLARDGTMCEEHPGCDWPHDDCAGPGMPWMVTGRDAIRALSSPPAPGESPKGGA